MSPDPRAHGNGSDILPAAPLLEVSGLTVTYPRGRRRPPLRAVDGVDLVLDAGRTVGVVGESGSGKSTLGSAILGLVTPSAGSVRFRGRDITRLGGADRRELARDLQVVFQDPYGSLNPTQTIGATLAEPLRLNLKWDAERAWDRVEDVLRRVGMPPGTAHRYPAQFSGGQRQRIAIARALTMEPALVVCDEPVSALDLSVQAQVLNLLADLQSELGIAYLFISHDLSVVRHMCDDVVVMYRGRIVESGPADRIHERPGHPYTRALVDAAPLPDPAAQRRRRARRAASRTPDQQALLGSGPGCAYAPRCSLVQDSCLTTVPPLERSRDGHLVACVRRDEAP
ncbi:ABC transporter ATP-binding protein [Streptomyces muensis]|uniref:ATP-binding cassette domain-containing protein n=1 Tax=Streptomyces muensis TaxID=1077944 RepID=A0A9X1PV61_STRM4|nr:oligopeptide/dipeptide ABC transporter ATP-binding protein [Streptomyces muensis]MCF1592293.1 ATP-binding cassette domain-containing protein [Streptomyces muensis]